MIRLEEVTPENWRPGLKVAREQEGFVADESRILARAFAFRKSRSQAFVVCNDETPVGMMLYYDCEPLQAYIFSELLIDAKEQGKGFGLQAARKALDLMKQDGKFPKAVLCYIEGNTAAKHLYEKLGFYHTGERDGSEIIMQLDF